MSLPLPDGWENWPAPAKRRLLDRLRRQVEQGPPFWCSRPGCDGTPHGTWDRSHARAEQRPPPPGWDVWFIKAGRGFGKTRAGAEWAWRKAQTEPRGALIGPTAADVRDTMIEGESGILATAPPLLGAKYEPSKRRVVYANGAIQTAYSADEPERLRGPQHFYAWGDEPASWRRAQDAWDNLRLGLRLGSHPEAMVTGTPKATPFIRGLLAEDGLVLTSGSTYANVHNLAPAFRRVIVAKYEGSRLGRQELHAEVLDDIEGAMFQSSWLRRAVTLDESTLARVVVGVDPAGSHRPTSDQTGIVVAARLHDGTFLVLADRSGRYTPEEWSSVVAHEVDKWGANLVVAETNYGGDMVRATLKAAKVATRVHLVRAARGKAVRAEPIAVLYEQGKVAHLDGLGDLETQMTEWVPGVGDSPDRMDAMVWALTNLSEREMRPVQVVRT